MITAQFNNYEIIYNKSMVKDWNIKTSGSVWVVQQWTSYTSKFKASSLNNGKNIKNEGVILIFKISRSKTTWKKFKHEHINGITQAMTFMLLNFVSRKIKDSFVRISDGIFTIVGIIKCDARWWISYT